MASAKSFAVLVTVTLAGSACHHTPPSTAPAAMPAAAPTAPTPPPAPPPPPAAVVRPERALTEEELFARKSLEQLNGERPLNDVFFDYDQNVLRDDARRVLEQDATWLKKWPTTVVRVDGHCDERGTPEYNLALGDRRAVVVRDYLVSLGVPASRVSLRSLGKEAPFCQDSSEGCWSQNRRDHFVITGK